MLTRLKRITQSKLMLMLNVIKLKYENQEKFHTFYSQFNSFEYIYQLMGCCVSNNHKKVRNILRKSTEPTRSTNVTNSFDDILILPFALEPKPNLTPFPHLMPSENVLQKQLSQINILAQDPQQLHHFNYEIGKGAFSIVFQMEQKSSGNISACKAIKLISKDHLTQIKNQIALMSMLDSPYTLKYLNSYFDQFVVYVFMEYIEGGSLRSFLDIYSNGVDEDVVAYILQQIILGVNVIHSKGIVHRDIKADNVLFSIDGRIIISDLGIAQMLTKKKSKLHNLIGTPAMMAPEMIKREPYDHNVDIWAMGIMAYQLYKGKVPVNCKCDQMTLEIIARSPPPVLKDASDQLQDFLGCCLQLDPSKRYGTQRLYNHPFIKNKTQTGKQKFKRMLVKFTSINNTVGQCV